LTHARIEAQVLLESDFVEEACTTEPLEHVLLGRSCPSVAKAFRSLLDAEAEGRRRHVSAPAELLDPLTEAGWTSRRCASEERSDVGTQASRAIVMRGERHHQIAIVLHPFLFSRDQQVDQVGLHKARIARAQQLRHLIERHSATYSPRVHIEARAEVTPRGSRGSTCSRSDRATRAIPSPASAPAYDPRDRPLHRGTCGGPTSLRTSAPRALRQRADAWLVRKRPDIGRFRTSH
jgi:hypothetical protein